MVYLHLIVSWNLSVGEISSICAGCQQYGGEDAEGASNNGSDVHHNYWCQSFDLDQNFNGEEFICDSFPFLETLKKKLKSIQISDSNLSIIIPFLILSIINLNLNIL